MNQTFDPRRSPLDLRSAADWQLLFVLLMLAAGFPSVAVSQIALGLWALFTIPFSTDAA